MKFQRYVEYITPIIACFSAYFRTNSKVTLINDLGLMIKLFNPFQHIKKLDSWYPWLFTTQSCIFTNLSQKPFENTGENEKMLVTSIFSIFQQCFLPFQNQKS